MIKEFQYSDIVDISRMTDIIESMQELLEALDEGMVPSSPDYSEDDLKGYLTSLVKGQRDFLGSTGPGSWAVAPNDDDMVSDARVDFIFRPTYIATATLTRSLREYPLIALGISGYRTALQTGMKFCSYRGLMGHGYEAEAGAIDALRVLSLGKVPWLLHRHPDFCPELKNALDEVARDMAQRLSDGDTSGVWGEDYSDGFRSAIETLRLMNDLDFMRSLEAARQDPTTLSEEELQW